MRRRRGAAWSSRRSNAARPTTRTITGTHSRWRIAVRQRYELTIDRREADALDQVLAGYASTELITFARGEVPGCGHARGPRSRGDRRVGRQPERPRQPRRVDHGRDARWQLEDQPHGGALLCRSHR